MHGQMHWGAFNHTSHAPQLRSCNSTITCALCVYVCLMTCIVLWVQGKSTGIVIEKTWMAWMHVYVYMSARATASQYLQGVMYLACY